MGAREVSLILVAAALKVFNNYISIHCLYNCEGEGRRNIYKRERERFSSRDAEWLVVQKKKFDRPTPTTPIIIIFFTPHTK